MNCESLLSICSDGSQKLNCQQERLDVISVWHDFKLSTKENFVCVHKQTKKETSKMLYMMNKDVLLLFK